jgi:hypothetical protein
MAPKLAVRMSGAPSTASRRAEFLRINIPPMIVRFQHAQYLNRQAAQKLPRVFFCIYGAPFRSITLACLVPERLRPERSGISKTDDPLSSLSPMFGWRPRRRQPILCNTYWRLRQGCLYGREGLLLWPCSQSHRPRHVSHRPLLWPR